MISWHQEVKKLSYLCKNIMDFAPEFLASSLGREFVAGGLGGVAGIISGYPLDTLRVRQQHSNAGSAFGILRNVVAKEGPAALYRGMGAPLASITFQVFPFGFRCSLTCFIYHFSIPLLGFLSMITR